MRLVIISDTHGKHEDLGTLSGDILIHCGDFCHGFDNDGSCIPSIDDWFARQRFALILCIGGNHDFAAQERRANGETVFENAIYLEDAVCEYDGLRIYGSPWVPELCGWAYYLPDAELRARWCRIPRNTDILITHTPPFGILDKPRTGRSIGCGDLRSTVDDIAPRVHCFGHVHASAGQATESGTSFINASVVDSHYSVRHKPTVIDVEVSGQA